MNDEKKEVTQEEQAKTHQKETETKKPEEKTVAEITKTESDFKSRLAEAEIVNNKTGLIIKVQALPTCIYTHINGLAVDAKTGEHNGGDFTYLAAQFGIRDILNAVDENGDPIEIVRGNKSILGSGTFPYIRSDVLDRLHPGFINIAGHKVIELSRMSIEEITKLDFTIR